MVEPRAPFDALCDELVRRRGSAAELLAFLARTQVPMVILDRRRAYVEGNPACRLLFRRTIAELSRLRADDLVPAASMRDLERLWGELERRGRTAGTISLRMPDGPPLAVDFCGLANALPGQHCFVFAPSRWPEAELARMVGELPVATGGALTEREAEVLGLLAAGADVREIAAQLSLSPHTVKTHLRNAVGRLGARHRSHAVAIAMRDGAIPAP